MGLGLGGNVDLILWLIMRASAKLVSKQKSIWVIPLEFYIWEVSLYGKVLFRKTGYDKGGTR